jgi:microbial collagenase
VKIKASMTKDIPVNQEIDFLSTDSTGQIVRYYWEFGDGTSSSEANPSHAFKKAGTYVVKLTLDFANNNVMTNQIEIQVTE